MFSNTFFSQTYRNTENSLSMLGCGSNVKAQWIRIIWLHYQITELQASGYKEKYHKDNTSQNHVFFFKKRKSNPSRTQFLLTTYKANTLIKTQLLWIWIHCESRGLSEHIWVVTDTCGGCTLGTRIISWRKGWPFHNPSLLANTNSGDVRRWDIGGER